MDLSTRYLGMTLKHPIVPSASPLTWSFDGIRALEEAGAAAIVMHSLFEEQITMESQYLDHHLTYGTDSFAEALNYFPDPKDYNNGPDEYLELIRKAKESCSIPIIGSLNGVSSGGWIQYARQIEQAGADALELNIYYIPTDPLLAGSVVEELHVEVVRDIHRTVSLPITVKLSPYLSAPAHLAGRLAEVGARGLVLFNRFYQPDLEIETLQVRPHLVLSHPSELRLPLRWTAILYGRVPVDLAISSGVHSGTDVLKGLMAGAKVTHMASELLVNGVNRIGEVLQEAEQWMETHEYASVMQMQGSLSQMNVAEPAAFERANYMKTLYSFRKGL